MKIKAKELLAALKPCVRVTTKPTTLPILTCVHLAAKDGALTITADNLQLRMTQSVACNGELAPICVPARRFEAAISGEEVQLKVASNQVLEIKGSAHAKLNGLSPDDFIAECNDKWREIAEGSKYAEAMTKTASHASRDDGRWEICGVNLSKHGVAATDGRRLAFFAIAGFDANVTIPNEAVPAIAEALAVEGAKLFVGDNSIRVENASGSVTARLVETQYVNFMQVIPVKSKKVGEIKCAAFIEALRQVEPFTTEKCISVRFDFSKEGCRITAQSPDIGECVAMVDGKFASLKVALNPRYMIEMLSIHDETAELFCDDELSPVMLKSGCLTGVVMPMRMT